MNRIRILLTMICGLSMSAILAQGVPVFVDGQLLTVWNQTDSSKLSRKIAEFKSKLWNEGYLFAGLDSVSQTRLYFHKGKKYEMSNSSSYRQMVGSAEKEFQETINSGYPFAQLKWDSLGLTNKTLLARYRIEPGPYIAFDSVILLSPIKTKKWFLEHTLGIQRGTAYSERIFRNLGKRLTRIDFIEEKSKADVAFQKGKANTYLDLKETSTGSFRGVLGVLPNQASQRRPLITGTIDLSLNNLFRSGKQLNLAWDRFGESSQKLDILYDHPFIFKSGLNLELWLKILKQDTSFLSANYGFDANWFVSNSTNLGVTYERSSNDVLLTEAQRITTQGLLDFDQNWYGVSLASGSGKDGSFRNFLRTSLRAEIGQRSIMKNVNLPAGYYDSIQLASNLWRLSGDFEFQHVLDDQFAIYSKLNVGHLSGNQLPINQLFRMGGLRTLRGFNEQFFFVESYLINRAEFRIFFEERSYLYAFWDQGMMLAENLDYPIGLGLGFSLETTSGLFSFAMALGANSDLPFDVASTKIHFGYLSRF